MVKYGFFCFVVSFNFYFDKFCINVEFDDGDLGRILLDYIRMLLCDYLVVCKYIYLLV